MNTPTEPEGGNKTSLIAYDSSGNTFKGAPIEVNGQNFKTNQNGVFDLAQFIGQKIKRILVNGIQLHIKFGEYILKRSDTLLASVKDRIVRLVNSDSTLLPHPVGSPES